MSTEKSKQLDHDTIAERAYANFLDTFSNRIEQLNDLDSIDIPFHTGEEAKELDVFDMEKEFGFRHTDSPEDQTKILYKIRTLAEQNESGFLSEEQKTKAIKLIDGFLDKIGQLSVTNKPVEPKWDLIEGQDAATVMVTKIQDNLRTHGQASYVLEKTAPHEIINRKTDWLPENADLLSFIHVNFTRELEDLMRSNPESETAQTYLDILTKVHELRVQKILENNPSGAVARMTIRLPDRLGDQRPDESSIRKLLESIKQLQQELGEDVTDEYHSYSTTLYLDNHLSETALQILQEISKNNGVIVVDGKKALILRPEDEFEIPKGIEEIMVRRAHLGTGRNFLNNFTATHAVSAFVNQFSGNATFTTMLDNGEWNDPMIKKLNQWHKSGCIIEFEVD
jgi:hypothetical protein